MATATAQPIGNLKKAVMISAEIHGAEATRTTLTKYATYLETTLPTTPNYVTHVAQEDQQQPYGTGNRNVIVRSLSKQGRLQEALHSLNQMTYRGIISVEPDTYACVLKSCINEKSLPEGKLVHAHIIHAGLKPSTFLGNALVIMYTKCGNLADARRVLDQMPVRNVVSWTSLISAYAKHGHNEEALALFYEMKRKGAQPNEFTFVGTLSACANMGKRVLRHGKGIHEEIKRIGCQVNVFLGSALVDMYVKGGSIEDARDVFDKMHERDPVLWNTMIAGYARIGNVEEAKELFERMPERNVVSWTTMIVGYAQHGQIAEALKLFQKMPERNVVSWNAMIAGYGQSGLVDEASKLFRKMPTRNVVSWTTMITGYLQNGFVDQALKLFVEMPERDVISWNAMISGYAQNGRLEEALDLFRMMPKPDAVSWNAMISGYAQTGLIEEALKLFWQMSKPDIVSWNVMIAAYARNGHGKEALKLYKEMQLAGVKPDLKTFSSILPACAGLASLKQGMEIHEDIVRSGFQSDVFVDSALVDMYAKCGRIEKARDLFEKMSYRNLVSWNIMIAGYAQNGDVEEAMKLFHTMPERDTVSWNAMIVGYSQSGHIDEACNLFNEMPQPDIISWNAMISGYAQNGRFKEAFTLFQKMPNPDIVTWNVMIAGFVQNGHSEEALNLFWQMKLAGVKPDLKCFASVLPACANLAALEKGMEIHEEINRSEFQLDVFVENALIDMYAKCGQIDKARELFDKMCQRYVVSWNTMIGGYAVHGLGKEAIKLFEQMQQSGVNPDHVTFVCVLSACCHAGLVNEGWQYFDCMGRDYHIQPTMEHYVCMVDLLGRAGRLDEAEEFINKMAIKHASVWRCLLGVCKLRNNVELGERVAERLYDLDPENATPYVLLSSIYAAAGRWDDAKNVRRMMKDRMIKKTPGCSWIEVNKQVHAFLMGERSHPQAKEISAKLETLTTELKTTGYVLHDVEEEQEEEILCHHSNKWAIALA